MAESLEELAARRARREPEDAEGLTELARRLAPSHGRGPDLGEVAGEMAPRARTRRSWVPQYAGLMALAVLSIALGVAALVVGFVTLVSSAGAGRDALPLAVLGGSLLIWGLLLAGFGEFLRAFRDLVRNSFR